MSGDLFFSKTLLAKWPLYKCASSNTMVVILHRIIKRKFHRFYRLLCLDFTVISCDFAWSRTRTLAQVCLIRILTFLSYKPFLMEGPCSQASDPSSRVFVAFHRAASMATGWRIVNSLIYPKGVSAWVYYASISAEMKYSHRNYSLMCSFCFFASDLSLT